ncbi:trigger factor [Mycoplasma phocimorsus]|uniref:Trigger factor n=2 Tax=Mycoplasma phocimorsus TaxID=3045839 RepID=A0AAJ1UZH7_9MOLU|nr:trigger factor [Mycoplasma phocimorsus]MDJ1645748.1 trigger factor [Mycoplasma phocimorsus]MDJ1647890.1 trigger factor [Mycoplasma phocimorsus]
MKKERNMTKINHLESSAQIEVIVSVDSKLWTVARENAVKFLQSQQKVKGFRPGHVPANLLRPLSEFEINNRAISKLFPKIQDEAYDAVKDNTKIIGRPILNVVKMDANELEVSFKYPTLPTRFDLDFSNLNLKLESKEITSIDVEKAIKSSLANKYALWTSSEDGVKEDSKINISFSGKIGGKEFEGGDADNLDIIMGENSFLPEFEQQLIGLKKGEPTEIKVILPKNYGNEEIEGKEAIFTVTINSIENRSFPEINDEFVKNLKNTNYTNYEEMFQFFKENEIKHAIVFAKDKIVNDAINKLIETNKIPTAEIMINEELKAVENRFNEKIKNLGFTKEDYFQYTDYTPEKLQEELKFEAAKNVQRKLVNMWIIEQLGLTVDKEEINNFYEQRAKEFNVSVDKVKKLQPEYAVFEMLLNDKFFDEFIKVLDAEGHALLVEGKLVYFK